MDRLLTSVLLLQMILAFFCPPIAVGDHLVFCADIWAFVWIPVFTVISFRKADRSERRFLIRSLFALTGLFAAIFIHGLARPAFTNELTRLVGGVEDAVFDFKKEAVVAIRFFIWCIGALIVSQSAVDLIRLKRGLAICATIAGLSIILAGLSSEIAAAFGHLYHYTPGASPWGERVYGVFRSPIEGCVTLCLSFLLLIPGKWAKIELKAATLSVVGVGVLLTKTMGGVLGLVAAILYAICRALPRKKVKACLLIGLALSALVMAAEWNSSFFVLKRANLVFRFRPWALYSEMISSRVDHFLFGTGFHPHFTDNIYLFLFSRGGMLLLGGALFGLVTWWKRNGKRLGPWQTAIPIFFLVSGLVVDNLILRPVAYLFIACAIRTLKGDKITSQA